MIKRGAREYNPVELEREITEFWSRTQAYQKTKEHRAGGERYAFVDGPPYTTGSVHLGTAWNKTVKDTVVRYRRMQGHHVRDQPGYDMHGLPIEVQVEKALGIRVKGDIEVLGIERFVAQCREYALARLAAMTEQFKQIGVWLDWDHPYRTIDNEYIESAWWTLGKARERDLLFQAERNLEWCPRCETPLAGYEVEYYDETDPSIFVPFPLEGGAEEYLVIWTTTPWTLPANMAIAVHPDFTYVKVAAEVGGRERHLWLLRETHEATLAQAGLHGWRVQGEARGLELVGRAYRHPLAPQVPYQASVAGPWVHKVLASPTVTAEFTGLVHMAPGHGPEDFEICTRFGIPAFCPVDERGLFTTEAGKYAGQRVRDANAAIVEDLRAAGALLLAQTLAHRYGHCWRCKTPLIYRVTTQWFLRVTAVKQRMLDEVLRVKWHPEWAGSNREYDWVLNARDWCISRQRYWGIPIPVWVCDRCHGQRLVTSTGDLHGAKGYTEGMDLHRPWIDAVVLKCNGCGATMHRVADVLDVWFDSAVASWASLHYPREEKAFGEWWPARWITEAPDQTRGWFYSQLGAGVVAFDRAPYDSILMHGWMLDAQGRAMHKSLGNYVEPREVIDRFGADALRLYLLHGSAPWEDINFQMEEVKLAQRNLNILWNVHRFATLYMAMDGYDPATHPLDPLRPHMRVEDRWVLSRLAATVAQVDGEMAQYNLHRALRALEAFVLDDLSRWYVKLVRDRTWVEGEEPTKLVVYGVLHRCLSVVSRLLAPFCPYMAEAMHQDLGAPLPTVHMADWPAREAGVRDEALEETMADARELVEVVSRVRQRRGMKLRWPVARILVILSRADRAPGLRTLEEVILDQANAKALEFLSSEESLPRGPPVLKPNARAIGQALRKDAPRALEALAQADAVRVAEALKSQGQFTLEFPGGGFPLTRAMVEVEEPLAPDLEGGDLSFGRVYVDFTLTPDLEAEGYAREVVRRVQDMRKELDLQVEDYLDTQVAVGERLRHLLEPWRPYMARETRSRDLALVKGRARGTLERSWAGKEAVDGEDISIGATPLRLGALPGLLRGLPGLTQEKIQNLAQAGLTTPEALLRAGVEGLGDVPGINGEDARRIMARVGDPSAGGAGRFHNQ